MTSSNTILPTPASPIVVSESKGFLADSFFSELRIDFFPTSAAISITTLLSDPCANRILNQFENLLKKNHCFENWSFLKELYELNQLKNIAETDLDNRLNLFCEKYFGKAEPDAVQEISIPIPVLSNKPKKLSSAPRDAFYLESIDEKQEVPQITIETVSDQSIEIEGNLTLPVTEYSSQESDISQSKVPRLNLNIPNSFSPLTSPSSSPRSKRGAGASVPAIDLKNTGINIPADKIYYINDLRLSRQIKLSDFVSADYSKNIITTVFVELLIPNIDKSNNLLRRCVRDFYFQKYMLQDCKAKSSACSFFSSNPNQDYAREVSKSKKLLKTLSLDSAASAPHEFYQRLTDLKDIGKKLRKIEKFRLSSAIQFSEALNELLNVILECTPSQSRARANSVVQSFVVPVKKH